MSEDLPSDVVAERVREVRKRRDMTAAELAARCQALGAPATLTAQAIANIESGRRDKETGRRRRHVTVDELLIFALALDVAPVHLLVPLTNGGGYWVTPKKSIKTGLVREWVRGNEPPPRGDRRAFLSERPAEDFELPSPPDQEAMAQFRQFMERMNREAQEGEDQ